MDKIIEKLRNEPVAVVTFIGTLLALAVSFGAHLSPAQIGAVIAAVNAGIALVARSKVKPATKPVDGQD